jgi:CDGSH-type Zn-finger protein/uncharacterized Fe-S cluster protein YjdI
VDTHNDDAHRRVRRYSGPDAVVTFDPTRCIHAAECVRSLPAAFDPKRRPWIDASVASGAELKATVMRCPTGALHIEELDGSDPEPIPVRNMVTARLNGPLYVRGELEIETAEGVVRDTRAALCRCGASKRKPFCDGSHREAGFRHDGGFVIGTPIAPPVTESDGPLRIRPSKRGPLLFDGILEIRSADLQTFARIQHPALCRCGQSKRKPFCDATHNDIGFDTE